MGKIKSRGDIDLVVRKDLDREKVLQILGESLGIPPGSIASDRSTLFHDFCLDLLKASYDPASRSVLMDPGIAGIIVSFNTMILISDGTFHDPFQGRSDLQKGIVRFVYPDPLLLRHHATFLSVLNALRWKHQLGFRFDKETQYIVRHLLDNQNQEFFFFFERQNLQGWVHYVRWMRTFLRLKDNHRWKDAYRLVEKFPLFGRDRKMFPLSKQKALRSRLEKIKEKNGVQEAVQYFRRFLKEAKLEPTGTDIVMFLDRGKQRYWTDDAGYLGRKVAELIKNAKNPEAAAKELLTCGFGPALAASGIRIQDVVNMRRKLQGVLHEGKNVTIAYLDDHEKRLLYALAQVLTGNTESAMAVLRDVHNVPELTCTVARTYLDALRQDSLAPKKAYDQMPLRKSVIVIADGLQQELPAFEEKYLEAYRRLKRDPLKQEAILNLACQVQETDVKNQLARPLLQAFGLLHWVDSPHEAGLLFRDKDLHLVAVRIPKPVDTMKPPLGLEILWHELAPTEEFFFLYNKQWQLIAVLPSIPEGKKFKNYSAKYLDLSPYFFDMPALYAPDFKARWKDFAAEWKQRQRAIEDVLPLIFCRYGKAKLEAKRMDWDKSPYFDTPFGSIHNLLGAAKPYVYAQFEAASPGKPGQDFPQHFVMFDPSEAENLDFSKGEDTYGMIVPIAPTVYPPNDIDNVHVTGSDQKYYSAILPGWAGMEIKESDIVCVKGPGSGLDFLLAARRLNAAQTGRPIYVQDVNPVSIAMIEELARREGISVITNVGSSLIGPDGQPVFGDVRFDKIIWNMPWFHTPLPKSGHTETDQKVQAMEAALRMKFSHRWDMDRGGEDLKRLLWEFPQLCREGGTAILWNRMGDVDPVAMRFRQPGEAWPKRIVPKMIEDFGLYAQIFPSSSQDAVFIVTLPSLKDSHLPRSENAILSAL